MNTNLKNIGELLTLRRKSKGLTQKIEALSGASSAILR